MPTTELKQHRPKPPGGHPVAEADRTETWSPIPGWPSYEKSSRGRVRSLPRVDAYGRAWPGKVLKIVESYEPRRTRRRRQVTLCAGGRRATYYLDTERISPR